MKQILTVDMNGPERRSVLGNTLASFGNENIRGQHIKYFEERVTSAREEGTVDVNTAPNYYAWLCLISEHVFWLMRNFCFTHDDLKGEDLTLQYNEVVTAFCEKCRALGLLSRPDLEELYGIIVRILYLRHALIHNGFPNLLPAGCENLEKRNVPCFLKTQQSRLKFNENEARELVSWYSKPRNFRKAQEEFRLVINAACKVPSLSVGF